MDSIPFLPSALIPAAEVTTDSSQRGQEWPAPLGWWSLNWALEAKEELFNRTKGFLSSRNDLSQCGCTRFLGGQWQGSW